MGGGALPVCGAARGLRDARGELLGDLSKEQRRAQGTASGAPRVLETWRRCWRCDCDGESHRGAGYEPTGAQAAVFAMAAHIEELTGSKPPTCPWRAMYSPLVGEVIRCANLAEKGALAPYVGTDPDARLMDALASYLAARGAVRAHDMEQEHKRREAERKRPRRG